MLKYLILLCFLCSNLGFLNLFSKKMVNETILTVKDQNSEVVPSTQAIVPSLNHSKTIFGCERTFVNSTKCMEEIRIGENVFTEKVVMLAISFIGYIVLAIIIAVIFVFAPRENILVVKDILNDFEKVVITDGVFAAIQSIKDTYKEAIQQLYLDITIRKLVLFVSVAVVVKQFPWIMDSVVKIFNKAPNFKVTIE